MNMHQKRFSAVFICLTIAFCVWCVWRFFKKKRPKDKKKGKDGKEKVSNMKLTLNLKIKQRIRFWNSLNFDSETYLSSSFRKRGVIFRTKVFGRKTRIKIDIPLPPYRNQNLKTIPTCVFHADKCLGR